MILAILLPLFAMSQSVPVSFTGRDANNRWVQLDRVVITDLTKGWSETIVWPDTTLTMQNGTGIYDVETMCTSSLQLSQNNPNPFNGTTDVLLTVADAGTVTLEITDVNGHIVGTHRVRPQCGIHQFRITLSAAGTYILTARQNGKTASIKMMNNEGGKNDGIEYAGIVETMCTSSLQAKSGTRGNTTNPFNYGDQMEYVGYATINGEECESQHVTQAQETEETIVLQFRAAQLSDIDPYSFSTEDTVFIVDGHNCDACSSIPVNITGFEQDAAITQASDILGVRVKIEHSFIADISITLICPNSRSIQLLPQKSHNLGGQTFTHFGIECTTDGSYCNALDNTPGTGWNYCWSEDTIYAQNNGYCFLSANHSHDREKTVDSSHLAIGYPGEDNFVQGQQYYMPYQPFSNLVGCPLNGLWQIQICDEIVSDNGYVFGWEITFSPNLSGGPSIDLERACPGTPILTDIDGNVYKTIQLGNQCWMRDNLRTTHFADNTLIPFGNTSSDTDPLRYHPGYSYSHIHTYGYLYNWTAMMHGAATSSTNPSGVQGICPDGWHVPSRAEWTELLDYVSSQSEFLCDGNASNIAKSLASTHGWESSTRSCAIGNNQSENNETDFSVLPAGDDISGTMSSLSVFWTTTGSPNPSDSISFDYSSSFVEINEGGPNIRNGFSSVRCLKD